MKNISRLQFTIEPWFSVYGRMELRVEAIVDGKYYNAVTPPFELGDFDSVFDSLIDHAKGEIKRLVKDGKSIDPTSKPL